MPNKPASHKQPWTSDDIKQLKRLTRQNVPASRIAFMIDRTESAVRSKAAELRVSLNRRFRRFRTRSGGIGGS